MIMKNLKNYKNRFYSLLESKMGDMGFNPLDGIFGSATELTVKKFQEQNNITPISGKVGPKTWVTTI
jgi:peptidoglycan hydrolase-like protein with peptidoglycan-binding domain